MTTPTNSTMGLAALIAATAAWGSTVVTIKIAARGLPALTITVIEVVAALMVLAAVLALRRNRPGPRRPNIAVLAAGVLEPGLAYPLINIGLTRTSGTHAVVIIGLESVLVVLLAAAIDRARPSRRVLLALGLAVGGATVLGGGDGGTATLAGDLLVLAGVLTSAAYVIAAQRQARTFDPVVLTFYQLLSGVVVILPLATVPLSAGATQLVGHPGVAELVAAVATGVLGSAVAFVLYNWALRHVSTTSAGTSLTLVPVFGIAFSASLLGEAITAGTVVAAVAVLAGVILAADPAPATGAEVASRAPTVRC